MFQGCNAALTQMNLQLHQVISDITGKTGLKIIQAMLTGETNPEILGGEYHDSGIDVYEQQYQQRVLKNLQRKADKLGFELVVKASSV